MSIYAASPRRYRPLTVVMSDGGVCVVQCVVRRACGVRRAASSGPDRAASEGRGQAGSAGPGALLYCSRAARLDATVACDGDGAEYLTRRVLPRLERAVHALCGIDAARLVKGGLGVGLGLG